MCRAGCAMPSVHGRAGFIARYAWQGRLYCRACFSAGSAHFSICRCIRSRACFIAVCAHCSICKHAHSRACFSARCARQGMHTAAFACVCKLVHALQNVHVQAKQGTHCARCSTWLSMPIRARQSVLYCSTCPLCKATRAVSLQVQGGVTRVCVHRSCEACTLLGSCCRAAQGAAARGAGAGKQPALHTRPPPPQNEGTSSTTSTSPHPNPAVRRRRCRTLGFIARGTRGGDSRLGGVTAPAPPASRWPPTAPGPRRRRGRGATAPAGGSRRSSGR